MNRLHNPDAACMKVLHDANLKITLGRVEVLGVLYTAETPLGMNEIHLRLHRSGSPVPVSSVYGAITKLEASGLVVRRIFDGRKAVFALAGMSSCNRLICEQCGRSFPIDDPAIVRLHRRIAARLGFTLKDYTLSMTGRCCGQCPEPRNQNNNKAIGRRVTAQGR